MKILRTVLLGVFLFKAFASGAFAQEPVWLMQTGEPEQIEGENSYSVPVLIGGDEPMRVLQIRGKVVGANGQSVRIAMNENQPLQSQHESADGGVFVALYTNTNPTEETELNSEEPFAFITFSAASENIEIVFDLEQTVATNKSLAGANGLAVVQGEPVAVQVAQVDPTSAKPAAAAGITPQPSSQPQAAQPKSLLPILGVAVSAIILLAAGTFLFMSKRARKSVVPVANQPVDQTSVAPASVEPPIVDTTPAPPTPAETGYNQPQANQP